MLGQSPGIRHDSIVYQTKPYSYTNIRKISPYDIEDKEFERNRKVTLALTASTITMTVGYRPTALFIEAETREWAKESASVSAKT